MDIRYQEWLPHAARLAGVVTAYWRVDGVGENVPSSAILPDGHVELVFNFGDSVGLAGPAYSGDQPARAIVGLLSQAIRLEYRGRVNTFGIRLHPARGPAYLGQSGPALRDKVLPLADVSSALDRALSSLFVGDWTSESDSCRAALDELLVEHLAAAPPADSAIVAVVDRMTQSEIIPPVAQLASELGLSPRQLRRRFLASVGVTPKQFVRMIRFARLWQMASMRAPETWAALAAETGYADQAHMVREFRTFGVDTPAHFFSADWYDATELSRASGPAKDVRSVQDTDGVAT